MSSRRILVSLGALLIAAVACHAGTSRASSSLLDGTGEIASGEPWLDVAGTRIEAHGGGMLQVGQRYFWYGEDHRLGFGNKTRISAYWLDPAVQGQTWARLFPNQRREAPAPFKAGSRYYMLTSAQSGWAPNPARYHAADRPLGPWNTLGNPVAGDDSLTTFHSQSAFVLPVPGACPRCFVYMGDRWEPRALERSTYVWMPFVVSNDGTIRIDYRPRWRLSDLRTMATPQ